MNGTRAAQRVKVTGDGRGVASHAGVLLLAELADRVGLTEALSGAMAHTRRRRSAHDPGVVLAHPAVMLANGGDCLADIAALRQQPDLFGGVASDPTVWRVLDSIHSLGLRNIAAARAEARAEAWAAGAALEEIVIDIDATLLDAHSDKQDATPTYKRGFGFYPILAYLDATGEGLAGVLRPGRVGSNNAADHLAVLDAALGQLPVTAADTEIVVRTDTAGATHDFIDGCTERGVGFLVGLPVDAAVRDAFMLVQEEDWIPAVETDGSRRDGAWLIELTDLLDHAWGEAVRVIARRERPHPGAQLTLFDTAEGFRHQVFITDRPDTDIAALELRHRHRAHVENRIRAAKDTGLRNLPCEDFVRNEAWVQLVLIAQDLHAWSQGCASTASSPSPNPRSCVTASGTPPPSSPTPAARPSSGSSIPGPGRPTSSSPSNAYASPSPAEPSVPTASGHGTTLTARVPAPTASTDAADASQTTPSRAARCDDDPADRDRNRRRQRVTRRLPKGPG